MRVIYCGNFRPAHSTENHVLTAMRSWGWEVTPLQEDDPNTFIELAAGRWGDDPDFFLWTRTGWDWNRLHNGQGFPGSERGALASQNTWLRRARHKGIPTVGYHLDIWWGLDRQFEMGIEPFFAVDLLVTADGGHADEWDRAGINHVWFPPAVSAAQCAPGTPRDEFRSQIAFVGSWQGGYHKESEHRHELVRWLQKNYRRDCMFWPKPAKDAIRGEALRDLYASVDVVVGDSCFVGTGLRNYWSDRIPETLGRGGFLLHPDVPGIDAHFTPKDFGPIRATNRRSTIDEQHFGCWDAGDFAQLESAIDWALDNPEERALIAKNGRAHVLEHHTYERRMQQLAQLLKERNMIS